MPRNEAVTVVSERGICCKDEQDSRPERPLLAAALGPGRRWSHRPFRSVEVRVGGGWSECRSAWLSSCTTSRCPYAESPVSCGGAEKETEAGCQGSQKTPHGGRDVELERTASKESSWSRSR